MMLEREKVVGGEIAGINVQNGCYCVLYISQELIGYQRSISRIMQKDQCYFIKLKNVG